jgi:hypothetical protein
MTLPAKYSRKIRVCMRPVKLRGKLREPSHYMELELEQVRPLSANDIAMALKRPRSLGEDIMMVLKRHEKLYNEEDAERITQCLPQWEHVRIASWGK